MPLREIEERDLELMLSWRNHSSVRLGMFSQDLIDLDQHRLWYLREAEKDSSVWLLHLDLGHNPAGVVYFTDLNIGCGNAFWGFYTAPGSDPGTGTRMGLEALDHFFVAMGLHKLNGEVLASNLRSHQFHLKLGFQVEGVFRDQYSGKDGYQNVTRYGLLDYEWMGHRRTIQSE